MVIKGREVNQRELAEILGVTTVTVWEWQGNGLPIARQASRGESNVYDTAAVIEWLIAQALARAGTEKERLEVEILQVELAEKRARQALREKTLVPADEVSPVWERRVLAAAAYMQQRASRLAGELERAASLEERRRVLKASDQEFLTHLGVNGEAIQDALDVFLARQPASEVQFLFQALTRAGHAGKGEEPKCVHE